MKLTKAVFLIFSLIMALSMVVSLTAPVSPAFAQEDNPSGRSFERPDFQSQKLDSDGVSLDAVREWLDQKSGPQHVMLQFQDEPSALIYARQNEQTGIHSAANAALTQLERIQTVQDSAMSAIQSAAPDATVLYATQRVYNGIAMLVDPVDLPVLSRLPGLKAIHPLPLHELDHTSSVPLIGAPEVWMSLTHTGQGIKIGVIDTGIDYLHKTFEGDPSLYATNDSTIIGDTPGYFPAGIKVVDGYDFAGDTYNASDPLNSVPQPDPDPMDCNGHGTHVAGTAAGFGVTTLGETFSGNYNSPLDFDDFRIGPGVAPKADLYALKVFGCSGSTALTTLAIEWAMDPDGDGDFSDRLDVINMSLGSSFGSNYDPSAEASNVAAQNGVIVVASAGNSGDTYTITGAPGAATWAISTASSMDKRTTIDGVEITVGSITDVYSASEAGFGADLAVYGEVSGEVVYANPAEACGPISGAVSGKLALIDRGSCTFVNKVYYAQAAGAIGVIVANNVSGDPIHHGWQRSQNHNPCGHGQPEYGYDHQKCPSCS
jgi:subtilisin family serine protease